MQKVSRLAALALSVVVGQGAATAASAAGASGPLALALAGVVAPHSPLVSAHDKHVIARLFDGDATVGFPPHAKIHVRADPLRCRVSNVDITARSCNLAFGTHKRMLTGRRANEIYATLAAAGVPSDGAAGSIFESITKLACTLEPGVIRQRAGGGATCRFQAGP